MKRLIYIVLLFSSINGLSQSYNFLHFTIEDGLNNPTILDLCEDKFGHLWIATQGGGLNKYDGNTFEILTIKDGLSSNFVRSVICDSKGNIWAATSSGISRYDGHSFTNFLYVEQGVNSVNVLHESPDGKIWFSNPSGGVGYIFEDSIEIFKGNEGFVEDLVIDIKSDESGRVWVLTNVQGLFKFEDGKFEQALSNYSFKGFLLSIEVQKDQSLLLGTNKGILIFNPAEKTGFNKIIPALKDYFIRSLTLDDDGNIWVALSNGVVKLSSTDIKTFSAREGFTAGSVNNIYKDREGTLWFGTEGDGIYKFSGELFLKLDAENGLTKAPVSSVVEDGNNNIWISTYGGGLDVYNGDSIIKIDNDRLPNRYITSSVKDEEGNLWFGSRGGIIKYDGTAFYNFNTSHGLVNNGIRCIYFDEEGLLWIGTVGGISSFNGKRFKSYTEADGLSENIIWQILPSDNGGVLVVTRNGIDKIRNEKLEPFIRNEEIFKNRLNAVLFDKKANLWVGYSGHGITRYNLETKKLTKFTTAEGLSSDFIYNLTWDNTGNLIVGTERGIDKIVLNEQKEIIFIKNYGAVEGFKGIRTSTNAVYKQKDGGIWFGSDNGAFKYQPAHATINKATPLTYISGIKLFYNDINWVENGFDVTPWHNIPVSLDLSHDQNHIIFQFKGISLKNPEEVKYQFMLENLETAWSPPTAKTEAAYTNLKPGSYTFRVRAANSDGVWSEEATVFNFEIKAPFWQQWWFYLLLIISIIAALKFYYDFRVQRKIDKLLMLERVRAEEQHNVRKKMARDFHDNMGNQLASITVFVNLITLKLKSTTPEVHDLLTNIERHTKSLFTGTKDFIWSMDPQSDEVNELYTYIKDFGEELFHNTPISFYSDINVLHERQLPSGNSRQIVLIFKEAMTNTLKHSSGDKVYFNLFLADGYYTFSLRDNGKTLNESEKGKGKGLRNMASRAEQIGATFRITHDQGFEVLLKIKINKN